MMISHRLAPSLATVAHKSSRTVSCFRFCKAGASTISPQDLGKQKKVVNEQLCMAGLISSQHADTQATQSSMKDEKKK